jgi:flagellar basal-body rod modification protein FlgD
VVLKTGLPGTRQSKDSGTMTTAGAVGSNSNAGSAASAAGSGALGSTSASAAYDTFLTLLTTQLQNQDPLNPTDTSQFTSEMIQLSGVEQELNINNTLDTMSSDLSSISASNGLGYIGKSVTATGSTIPLQDGSANWDYNLPSTASNVTLTVQDSSGNTVYSTTGNPAAGQHSFTWNGNNSSGTAEPAGDYTLQVAAVDGSGNAITTTTEIVGTVTGVDTSNGTTELQIGDVTVPASNVTQLNS